MGWKICFDSEEKCRLIGIKVEIDLWLSRKMSVTKAINQTQIECPLEVKEVK